MASEKTLKLRGKPLPVNYLCCSKCHVPFGIKWQQPATIHKIRDSYYCETCLNKR